MTDQDSCGNPYFAGPAITEDQGFYGRQDTVENVIHTLTASQQNAIVLHGQRRIGKTSLLHRLKRDKTLCRDHVPILFTLQSSHGFPTARILADLAEMIVAELNLDIARPTATDLSEAPHRFRRVFLPEVYQHLGHKRLLFLFDEFDEVVPSTEHTSTETIIDYLQTLIDGERKRLAFVFVVGQRLDLLSKNCQRLFKGVQAEPVHRFGRAEADALLTESGRRADICYDAATLDEIWDLTNGHPYFTQLIGSQIFERLSDQKSRRAQVSDVQACLEGAMDNGKGALNWYWGGFNSEQQWVLSAVADQTGRDKSITDVEIKDTLKQNKLFVTDLTLGEYYRQFLQGDFLYKVGGTPARYRFAIEFFRLWIVENHSIQKTMLRLGESNPEALGLYQLGKIAFEKGKDAKAEDHYREAIGLNSNYLLAYKALALALLHQSKPQEAIKAYEDAYRIDPDNARQELSDQRLDYAQELEEAGQHEKAVGQIKRVLEIDEANSQARQLLIDIYVGQADAHLKKGNLAGAVKKIEKLNGILPVNQNATAGQRVLELWLSRSKRLAEQGRLDKALATIQSLSQKSFNLLDQTAIAAYNEIVLTKLRAFLEKGDLDHALATLKQELKPPFPAAAKDLLLGHSRRLVGKKEWEAAEKTLIGLRERFDARNVRSALVKLYLTWVDVETEANNYDKALKLAKRAQKLE